MFTDTNSLHEVENGCWKQTRNNHTHPSNTSIWCYVIYKSAATEAAAVCGRSSNRKKAATSIYIYIRLICIWMSIWGKHADSWWKVAIKHMEMERNNTFVSRWELYLKNKKKIIFNAQICNACITHNADTSHIKRMPIQLNNHPEPFAFDQLCTSHDSSGYETQQNISNLICSLPRTLHTLGTTDKNTNQHIQTNS